jgi:hypothetical protein
MLRITEPVSGVTPSVFVLEGKLTSAWIDELLRATHMVTSKFGCIFDIEEVSYVDKLGEETLSWLSSMGACFAADSLYGRDLCRRLNLHRVPRPCGARKGGD